jgi:hypothetical protein
MTKELLDPVAKLRNDMRNRKTLSSVVAYELVRSVENQAERTELWGEVFAHFRHC